MKRFLQIINNIVRVEKIAGLLFFLSLLPLLSFGIIENAKEVTLVKTVSATDTCNHINIQLGITGQPSSRPVEVILVIDRSGSMNDTYPWPITHAKNAAKEFAQKILIDEYVPGNKIGIVSYSYSATLDQSLTSNYSDVFSAIDDLEADGYTNIADGFIKAANELNTNGTHDCKTIRSIVFLTDGVANRAPGCSPCSTWPTSPTCCTNAAIAAGQAAQSFNGYETRVYTIGLFGAISGSIQNLAEGTMDQAQNGGFWQTESSADLSGIYAEITNQLVWAAKDMVASDTIPSGFSIAPGSISASKGTANINGQVITWNIDAIYNETATLDYILKADEGTCGAVTTNTAVAAYENSSCQQDSLISDNPSFCVPCIEITSFSVSQPDACSDSIDYSAGITVLEDCSAGTASYQWEFFLGNVNVGSSAQLNGTFTIPANYSEGSEGKTFKGILTVNLGSGESGCVSKVDETTTIIQECYPDYGDAPGYAAASHTINNNLIIGALVDHDSGNYGDGTDNNGNATDDDIEGSDDEDGLSSVPALTNGDTGYTLENIKVTNTTGNAGTLHSWIDLDKNGTFDSDEYTSVAVPGNSNNINVTLTWSNIPVNLEAGISYLRLRLTTDNTINSNTPGGLADDGEVEDYQFQINNKPPSIDCPADTTFEGCSTNDIMGNSTLVYSESSTVISVANFEAEGGVVISNGCGIKQISYQDSKSGTNPIIVTRVFTITNNCDEPKICTQTIEINVPTPQITCPPEEIIVYATDNLDTKSAKLQILPPPEGYTNQLKSSTILKSASGAVNGFITLGGWNSTGVPDYLEPTNDIIGSDFIDDIENSLPESVPLPETHPEYLANGVGINLKLVKDAEVWVTFLLEGAGFKNVLGYFHYPTDNPPQSATDIDNKIIIFPNSSFQGSGGGLYSGNKVRLKYLDPVTETFKDTFPANTTISWFLAADGWDGSNPTSGLYTHYSIPGFNNESDPGLQQHNVLLYDELRKILVLGFEDIRRDYPSCDHDFNDAVFYSTVTPYSAIDTTDLPSVDYPSCAEDITLTPPEITDECDLIGNVYNNAPDSFQVGETVVTWSIENNDGDVIDSCIQTVIVIDDVQPTIAGPPDIIVYSGQDVCYATNVTLGVPDYSDNCGVKDLYNNANEPFQVGVTNVTWTVVDYSDNKATSIQKVTVLDTVPPVVNCGDITIDGCNTEDISNEANGLLAYSTEEIEISMPQLIAEGSTASDNCEIKIITYTDVIFSTDPLIVIRTFEVTDQSGNKGSCEKRITLICNKDFGDAPGYSEASHKILPNIKINDNIDKDSGNYGDGTDNNANATDDDTEGTPDDEDGLSSVPVLTNGDIDYVLENIKVTNTTGNAGTLHGWIDLDKNGTFDSDEYTSVAVAGNSNNINVTLVWENLPVDIAPGTSYLRLRLTTDNTINSGTPGGLADDGEVEDYQVTFDECRHVDDPNPRPELNGESKYKSYEFHFEGGSTVAGTSIGNANTVEMIAGTDTMNVHISCSDLFTNGWGDKGDPTREKGHPRVISYKIWKYDYQKENWDDEIYCWFKDKCYGEPDLCDIDVYDLPDTTVCESYTLPPVPGQNLTLLAGYFTAPDGGGTKYAPGTIISSTKTLYIYDEADTGSDCQDQESFTITVSSPEINLFAGDVLCNGDSSGYAWVKVTGGTPRYSYLWDNSGETTDSIFNLPAKTYSVIVTDANGCTAGKSIDIEEPAPISFNIKTVNPIGCYGGSTVAIISGLNGGTPDYEYSWSTGSTSNSSTVNAGWAYVTVTDANGCEKPDSIYVSQPDSMVAEITLIDSVSCYGEYNAVATVNAYGGNANYHYLWDNGETTKTVTNLNAGKHWVTVVGENENGSCTASDTIIAGQPDALIATATQGPEILCYGDDTGTAIVSIEGGTEPYTYLWNDASNQSTSTVTGLVAGTYTVTVTDANGCEDEAQVTITQPTDLTVSITNKTNVDCYGGSIGSATAQASGGKAPYSYSWNTVPQQTGPTATGLAAGTYTVVVTDANECEDSVEVTIEGSEKALEIDIIHTNTVCPGDATGIATANVTGGTAPYTYTWDTDPVQDSLTATGLVAGLYTATVTDTNQCQATDSVTITQVDSIPPVAVCKDFTAYLDENGSVVITGEDIDGGSYDNCSECCGITIEVFPSQFSCADVGDTTVYLIVTDNAGLKDTCEAIVTIKDGIDPVAICKDTTVYLDENGQFLITARDINNGSYDNCDSITMDIIPNILSCDMVNTKQEPENVGLFVYDKAGNFDVCIADIIVLDSIAPVVECPEDFEIYRDTTCEFRIKDYTGMAHATDNCKVDRKTQSPAALTVISDPTMVTIYAYDKSDNVDSCSFWVTPVDSIKPTVICPGDQLVAVDANCEFILPNYIDSADISKHCLTEGDLAVVQSPDPGTIITRSTEVTITVTDDMGNFESCSFNIIPNDTTPPEIECPEGITVECIDEVPDADTTLVTAFDNCGNNLLTEFVVDGSDGNTCPEIITRTYKTTDPSGNFATCTQTITVNDTTKPTFTAPSDITIYKDNNCGYAATVDITGDVTDEDDNCSSSLEAKYEDEETGNELCGGSTTILRTWTLTDECGNSTTQEQIITVLDTTKPTFSVPSDITIYKNEYCQFDAGIEITGDVTDEADNCGSGLNATFEDELAEGSCEDKTITTITRTWSLSDDCENTTTHVQLITVKDTIAPSIECLSEGTITRYVDEDCQIELGSFVNMVNTADNCTDAGSVLVTQVPAPGSLISGTESPLQVWMYAEDYCGNVDSCSFTVELLDTIPPMADCPGNDSIPLNEACVAVLPDYTFESLSDNCTDSENITVYQNPAPGFTFISTVEVTLYVTDDAGNVDSCSFSVTPFTLENDTVICPNDTTIYADANCEATLPGLKPYIIPASCTDVDVVYSWTQLPLAGTAAGLGNTTVTLNVYNEQELVKTCDVNVTVTDTTIEIVCPGDKTVAADENCTAIVPDVLSEIEIIENCTPSDSLVITQNPLAGTIVGIGTTTITISVADRSGNVDLCSLNFNVVDRIPPTIACPEDREVPLNEVCEIIIGDYTSEAEVSDNCSNPGDINVTQIPISGTVVNDTTEITLYATDKAGNINSCSFLVIPTVSDSTIIVCPDDRTITVAQLCQATVPVLTPDITVTSCTKGYDFKTVQSPLSGEALGLGTTTVTVTVYKGEDIIKTCLVDIEVVDSIAPTIECPADASAEAQPGGCNADVVVALPEFDDNCPGAVAINDYNGTANASDSYPVGTTIVTWTLTDASGNTAECAMSVTVLGTPDAIDDNAKTPEKTPVGIDILANDIDCNNLDNSTIVIINPPSNGQVAIITGTDSVTYTPDNGFSGADVFQYRVCNLDGLCDSAFVTVVVNSVNNPPIAENDINSTLVDTPVNGNVLTNDSDPDGDPLTVNTTVVSNPLHGTVTIGSNGSYTYTPESEYFGNDEFTYRVCDDGGLCDEAIVSIKIVERPEPNVNRPPVAVNDNTRGNIGTPVTGNLLANDFDPDNDSITVIAAPVTAPNTGNLVINGDGTFTYNPETGFTGIITFEYEIFDDGTPSLRDTATVTIRIEGTDDTNTTYAIDDMYEGNANGGIIAGDVGNNDYDPEGDNQSFSLVNGTGNGTLIFNPDGTFIYEPNTSFTGTDSYTYTACDDGTPQACDIATVYILIEPEMLLVDPPRAEDDSFTATCETISGNTLENDAYVLDISVGLVSGVSNGALQFNADGTFDYTPGNGFIGDDSFIYKICYVNDSSNCDTATVTINVEYDPTCFSSPEPVDDNYLATCHTIFGNILENDDVVINDILAPTIISGAMDGELQLNSDGAFEYTPYEGFVGVDSFVYEICYAGYPENCGMATATIEVVYDPACTPCSELFIPNAFSPNGDGVHDYFIVECIENLYPDAKLMIFNRWGNLVYEREHYGNLSVWDETKAWWDGTSMHAWTVGNEKLPDGTYMYVLILDKNTVKKGTVYLNY